jgi:hypothetical protein
MGKRASFALGSIAVLELCQVAKMLLIGWMREDLLSQLTSGSGDREALFAKLHLFSQISLWVHVGIALLVLAGMVLLATALGKGRGFAIVAVALLLVHGVVFAIELGVTMTDPIPTWMKAMWWLDGTALGVAWMLPLVAAARARPSSFSRLGVAGAAGIAILDAGVSLYGFIASEQPSVMPWLERAVAFAAAAWFASFAFPLAKRLATSQEGDVPARAGEGPDGAPLRTLGWALLGRIGLGIVLAVLVTVSVAQGEYESAGSLSTISAALGGLISVVILVALIQYLRLPEAYRSEALVVTIGFVVLGVVLDVVAAKSATELFHAVGEAKRATSFWGMPSLSKMEELQTTMTWAGRGGLALGFGAGLALAASLGKTAQALGDAERSAEAKRVSSLLVIAGSGAVVVSFLAQALARDAAPLLLILALALLVVAVMLLASWTRLLFGLARALEQRAGPESG